MTWNRLRAASRLLIRAGVVGFALALVGCFILLVGELLTALRRDRGSAADPPSIAGSVGLAGDPPLRLAVLGDSSAAGHGVGALAETVAGQLATRLASAGWRVELLGFAIATSRIGDLGPQVSRALLARPDVVVVLIGAEDVLRLTRSASIGAGVVEAVRRCRDRGIPVVVGTTPDLAATTRLPQPLRSVAGFRSRRIARTQALAAISAGALSVDLAAACGPVFRADPGLLAADHWNPSGDGTRIWADALESALIDAAGSPNPR